MVARILWLEVRRRRAARQKPRHWHQPRQTTLKGSAMTDRPELDVVIQQLQEDVATAASTLMEIALQSPDKRWSAHELKIEAYRRGKCSSGALTLALNRLVTAGFIEQDEESLQLKIDSSRSLPPVGMSDSIGIVPGGILARMLDENRQND